MAGKNLRYAPIVMAVVYWLRHPATFFVAATIGLIWASGWAWNEYRQTILSHNDFVLTDSKLFISPGPNQWVPDDATESLRGAILSKAPPLIDRQLIPETIEVINQSPYVDSINLIHKSANRLDIQLRYREPIAWTPIDSRIFTLVDRHGVVLPQRVTVESLPRDRLWLIVPPNRTGLAPIGQHSTLFSAQDWQVFPDERVLEGAKICEQILDHWQSLGICQVVSYWGYGELPLAEYAWELWTPTKKRVVWASPKTSLPQTEVAKKIDALYRWIAENGPLDSLPPGTLLDLRDGNAKLIPQLRQAKKELPFIGL